MKMRAILLAFIVGLEVLSFAKSNEVSYGSTPQLKYIVLGRCWFKKIKDRTINCTALWEAFRDSFAFKDPCKLTFDDYELFFNVRPKKYVTNKSLFWSGTYKAVHDYSDFDLRYTTLEDTLEGLMMNNLKWCGNPSLPPSSDGIDYKSCPKCIKYNRVFWGLASKKFAQRVRGVVHVMVNGTRGDLPAYNRSSFFGKYELPNFNVVNVTKLLVLVIHTIDTQHKENCNKGSIPLLKQDAKKRGITVECTDDQDDVKHILCADWPQARECLFASEKPIGPWKIATFVLIAIASVFFTTTLVLIVYIIVKCRRKQKKQAE